MKQRFDQAVERGTSPSRTPPSRSPGQGPEEAIISPVPVSLASSEEEKGKWAMVQVISPDEVNRLVLNRGASFVKHGRMGNPHPRWVWLSADCSRVLWQVLNANFPDLMR
jgi:hypothetical protein